MDLTYHGYTGAPAGSDADYEELRASIDMPLSSRVSLFSETYYTHAYSEHAGSSTYFVIGPVYTFDVAGGTMEVDANVGYNQYTARISPDYIDWDLGITYSHELPDWGELAFKLRYYGAQRQRCGPR